MDEKLKKGLSLAIVTLLILNIPLILYLLNFKLVAFNKNFYKKEFLKYKIYDDFPGDDIEVINSDLLYYMRHGKGDEYVNIDLFNDKEKGHLVDVKKIIQTAFVLLNVSIIFSILLIGALFWTDKIGFRKKISWTLIYGGIFTFFIALVMFILIKINFNSFFDGFHKTFFKDGTWLFDEGSDIIRLYTSQFFYDTTLSIVIRTLAIAFIFITIGLFSIYRLKRDVKKREHYDCL